MDVDIKLHGKMGAKDTPALTRAVWLKLGILPYTFQAFAIQWG
jgi:hypothetical protein